MDDTLLARWLNNTLTDAEREELEQHPDFPDYQRIAETAARMKAPDAETERLWPHLQDAVKQESDRKVLPAPHTRRRWWWYSAAAAAAVAALVIFLWSPWDKMPLLVQTGIGEQKTVTLPDGSIIKMNAASELQIETADWSEVRRVTLHGDAFFDVKSNPEAPFYVITPNGKVTVLGTTFSVFDREKGYEVACFRGLVKVESEGLSIELPTSRKIASTGTGTWLNSEVNEGDTPAWIKGETVFTNAALTTVIAELERQYDITINSKVDGNQQFTGAFPNKNLNLALEIVCKSLHLKYQADGKNIILEAL